jgi:hypothetical protein
MRVELYTISWNEQRMLPYFLEYYTPWVDRFVIFDDASDDGTAQMLAQHPKVDLRPFPPKGDSFVLTALELYRHAWKESRGRADWVICTNVDEFVYHPDGMRAYLRRCSVEGATLIHPRGYAMVGSRFPEPGADLVRTLRRGVPMFGSDKRQVFDPNALVEIDFGPGRHGCRPTGRVVEPATVEAALLHYKYVDPRGYLLPRQRALGARLLEGDRRAGFGSQYRLADEQVLALYDWLELHATEVVPEPVPPAASPARGESATAGAGR